MKNGGVKAAKAHLHAPQHGRPGNHGAALQPPDPDRHSPCCDPLFSPVTSKRGTVIPEPSPGAVKPNPGSQAGEVSMHLAENVPCDEDLSPACDKGTVLLSRF